MRNIKRFPIVLLMAVMLVLTACGGGSSNNNQPSQPVQPQPAQYTVTFNTNGGSNVPSQRVNADATVAEPTAPTRDHYEFDGWYRDSALTTPAEFPITVTANVTLYAGWDEIVYTQRPAGNGWYVVG